MTQNRTSKAKILRACGEAIKPSRHLDYKAFLQACFNFIKDQKESYSYIQFAEDLGFSLTNVMHLIIRGRRRLSTKAAAKISVLLNLKGFERQYFETLVEHNNARLPQDRDALFARLVALKNKEIQNPIVQDQLDYYTSWYHPVIRELIGLSPVKRGDASFVDCIQPRVLPEQGRRSLELLQSLGLIRYDEEKDQYIQVSKNISTGDEIRSLAVIGYHKEVIEIGRDSMTTIAAQRRDIGAVTIAIDEATAQRIKTEIQNFRKALIAIADECKNPDQIYQVNIQLFPFTKA